MPDDDKARVMRARSFRCSLPLFLVLLAGCNRNTRVTNMPPPPGPPKAIVVVAVGDISCDPASKFYNQGNGTAKKCHMLATSSLAISIKPEAALLLGDTQYDTGSPSAFEQSYAKTWGRKELKDISYPSIGPCWRPAQRLLQLRSRNVAPDRPQLRRRRCLQTGVMRRWFRSGTMATR